MLTLGVEPGTHGAIAALDGREVVLLVDLPVHTVAARGRGDRAELDFHSLHALIIGLGPVEYAFVEKVAARLGNGSVLSRDRIDEIAYRVVHRSMLNNSNERLTAVLVPVRELLRDVESKEQIPSEVVLSNHLRLDRGMERLRCADAS
jgi:hypothetical protein